MQLHRITQNISLWWPSNSNWNKSCESLLFFLNIRVSQLLPSIDRNYVLTDKQGAVFFGCGDFNAGTSIRSTRYVASKSVKILCCHGGEDSYYRLLLRYNTVQLGKLSLSSLTHPGSYLSLQCLMIDLLRTIQLTYHLWLYVSNLKKEILYFSETLVPTYENTMCHSQKNTILWTFQFCRPNLDIWSSLFSLNFLLRFCTRIYGMSWFFNACCIYRQSRPVSFIHPTEVMTQHFFQPPLFLPFCVLFS